MVMRIWKWSKQYFLEIILGFLFLIPFFAIGPLRSIFSYTIRDFQFDINLVLLFVLILFFALSLALIKKEGDKLITRKLFIVLSIKVIFDLSILFSGISKNINLGYFFTQYLWFILPGYYGLLYVLFINKLQLDHEQIIKIGLVFFAGYIIFNIVINGAVYDFIFGADRLISPGGGPVIFGYSIALLFTVLVAYDYLFKKLTFYLLAVIYLVGSLATGSRASMIPVLVIFAVYFFVDKKIQPLTKLVIVLVAFSALMLQGSLLLRIAPRLTKLATGSRGVSAVNTLRAYGNYSLIDKLSGRGLTGFFPYQQWNRFPELRREFTHYNRFLYNGEYLLVQPHNSFLMALMELGLLRTILLICFFGYFFIKNLIGKDYRRALFTGVFIVLNLFDSIIFVSPGSSALWMSMFFLVAVYKPQRVNVQVNKQLKFQLQL